MTLRIAPNLELPPDAVTQAIAILARRGAGKTYTAKVIVEEIIRARQPVVVLDPTGAWWGLRSSADGTKPGLPVVIFGGEHGDVPLDRAQGRDIANVVIDHPGAYIVDLSGFESKRAEQTFVADFLERLYRGKAERREPLMVVVDEADGYAPQRPMAETIRTLGALEAIVRRGRIRGLGCLLVTQRAAVLNKNVLTQTEMLIIMQTTGPQDRAAIDEWIKGNGTDAERSTVLESLASLERGEAWVWSPSWLRRLVRVRIRTAKTFDSSRTPEAGESTSAPQAYAKVDIEALGERIRVAAETAKANDPAALRAKIAELERRKPKEIEVPYERVVDRVVDHIVEVPVLDADVAGKLFEEVDRLRVFGAGLVQMADQITTALSRAQAGQTDLARAARHAAAPKPAPVPVTLDKSPVMVVDPSEKPLDAGARRMLASLARMHPTPLLRSQLGTLADVAWTSGTFRGYLSRLRTAGLIEEPDKNTVQLSAAGVDAMRHALGSGAPSVEELVEMWNRKLDAGARRMLRILVDVAPDGLSRAELGERAEVEPTSGTFRGYLSRLRVNRLIDESTGAIRAGEALFLGGPR